MELRSLCFLSLVIAVSSSPSSQAHVHEHNFSEVNHILKDIYGPLIKLQLAGEFELNAIYDTEKLKADLGGVGGYFNTDSARKFGSLYVVTLTGTVPQSLPMEQDGYAVVACHEFGHIFGGTPRQSRNFVKFSSVEGQADYWATNVCMWQYVNSLKSSDVIHEFDPYTVKRCNDSYGYDVKKYLGCLRIMSGIQAMIDYFNLAMHGRYPEVSIYKHDDTVVEKTIEKYGSPQCRVDTWLAGLFNKPRPHCWYAEEATPDGASLEEMESVSQTLQPGVCYASASHAVTREN